MLELRPICENCATALPPSATDAMICSFECTFCARCVADVLDNVCPNCGGGFCPRPIRPQANWNDGNCVATYPPSTTRRHHPVVGDVHRELVGRVGALGPEER